MKKVLLITLAVFLVGAIMLGGCAQTAPAPAPKPTPSPAPAPAPTPAPTPAPAPAPTPMPTPTPAPAPAPAAKVIKLKFNDQNPQTWFVDEWLNAVGKATNGRIQWEVYPNQTLSKGADAWEATRTGIADVSWLFLGYWPQKFPLTHVYTLPFLNYKSAERGGEILLKLYEKFPSIQAEWKENKVLFPFSSGLSLLWTTKKQVKNMEDLKGLKIRNQGGPLGVEAAKLLGMVPMLMPMPDVYLNMQKGVIDGGIMPWEPVLTFKLYEHLKYCYNSVLWSPLHGIVMNWNTWNKLPADVQKQLESVCGTAGAKMWGKNMFDWYAVNAPTKIKEAGGDITVYTPPGDEEARWAQVGGKPIWDGWVKDQKAAGLSDAQAIMDYLLELIKTTP